MLKKLRDVVIPAFILGTSGITAAWTLAAFVAPMPVFEGQAVVIVASSAHAALAK